MSQKTYLVTLPTEDKTSNLLKCVRTFNNSNDENIDEAVKGELVVGFGKEVCEYKDGDLCLVLISSDLWALRYSNGVKNEFYRDQKTSGETITYVKHRLANIELPI